MGLSAYVVQRVSGEPLEQYLQHHIVDPLGMIHSSAYQPPAALAANLVNGYILASEPPVRPEFTNALEADGVVVTGADMARYMIMHLHEGRDGDAQIMPPETARLIHSRTFSAARWSARAPPALTRPCPG